MNLIDLNEHDKHKLIAYIPSPRFIISSEEERKFFSQNWPKNHNFKRVQQFYQSENRVDCFCCFPIIFNILEEDCAYIGKENGGGIFVSDTRFYNDLAIKLSFFHISNVKNSNIDVTVNENIRIVACCTNDYTFDMYSACLTPQTRANPNGLFKILQDIRISYQKPESSMPIVVTDPKIDAKTRRAAKIHRVWKRKLERQMHGLQRGSVLRKRRNRYSLYLSEDEVQIHKKIDDIMSHHYATGQEQDLTEVIQQVTYYRKNHCLPRASKAEMTHVKRLSMEERNGILAQFRQSFMRFWNIDDVEIITGRSTAYGQISLTKFSNPRSLDIGADFNYKIKLGSHCQHKNVTLKIAQTRSGDEGQETYKYCNDCKRIL